jgi:hypothetical protein
MPPRRIPSAAASPLHPPSSPRAPRLPILAAAVLALALAGLPAAHAAPTDPARPVPFARILDRVEKHAVSVSLRFQKDLKAEAEGAVGVDPDSATETYRRWRMSMRVPGFAVRDRRTVLVSDVYMPVGAIRSVEVTGRDGGAVPAAIRAFLPRCGAIALETQADLSVEPVAFPAKVEVGPETPLFVGSLAEGLKGLETWAEALGTARRRAFQGAGFSYGQPERSSAGLSGNGSTRTTDLVVREDGTPMGFRFGGGIDLAESVWRGPDVLDDLAHAVPFASLKDVAAKVADAGTVHQLRVYYRTDDPDDGGGAFEMFSRIRMSFPGRGSDSDPDARLYGIAVSNDLLVVPASIPEEAVKRIERIVVEDDGDPTIEAKYEGKVRGYGMFVVRLQGGYLKDKEVLPADRPAAPAAEHAFLVHRVSRRSGARRDLVEYDRSLGTARGYGDRRWFVSEQAIPAGSFLLDLEGRVLGLAVDLVPEDVERASARGRRGEDDGTRGVVAALFADLGEPEALAKDLDRRVLPQRPRDSRKLPWLGVELEGIRGSDLAEALGVSAPTRDGSRGLLVNRVYEGSPAAKAGIAVDDVLLSARRTSGPGSDAPPIDLRDSQGSDWSDEGPSPRPWRARGDAVVKLLDGWGIGTTYDLEVLRDGKVTAKSLVVEASPPDFASAKKAKDEGTGLTVKELTYEVRAALHLSEKSPGVVVADVEEGSSAAQARVLENELVLEMDGKPVADPAAFSAGLAAARTAGKDSVRVVVLRLDRSRFVDLRLAGPPAAVPKDADDGAEDAPPEK